jgi:putative ABC transport system ATP-binding protein
MTPNQMIYCRRLSRIYGAGPQVVKALNDVTFSVQRGEFVAITGPSGSGKSTLLNLLGILDKPTSGELLIGGEDVGEKEGDELAILRSRGIGFVFQQFNLLPRVSALENVKLPLHYASPRVANKSIIARAKLEEVGLGERFAHTPARLSGGEQQRVAIARALVNNPSIILADEPTGALDTKTTGEIMTLFSRLNASGLTVIVVTHEADVAAFAGRVLRFRDGWLIDDRIQTPREL